MPSRKRQKRPELDRSGPKRKLDGLFGAQPPRADSERSARPNGGAFPNDTVTRGVDLGYQVIEEYMRQGQAFARAAWDPYLPRAASSNGEAQRLAERVYQYASDLAAVWLDYVRVATVQAPVTSAPRSPSPRKEASFHAGAFNLRGPDTNAHSPGAAAEETALGDAGPAPIDEAATPEIAVEIASRRHASVRVDLKPGSVQLPLSVHALRAKSPQLPRISDVAIERCPSENRILVRINVPPDQPAATYVGLVVDDETNLPRGSVTVRISD
jgi:hypothetical protein